MTELSSQFCYILHDLTNFHRTGSVRNTIKILLAFLGFIVPFAYFGRSASSMSSIMIRKLVGP